MFDFRVRPLVLSTDYDCRQLVTFIAGVYLHEVKPNYHPLLVKARLWGPTFYHSVDILIM